MSKYIKYMKPFDAQSSTSTTKCICCGGYVNDGWVCDRCLEKYEKSTPDPIKIEQCVSEMKQFITEISNLKHSPVSDMTLLKADRNMALIEAYIARRR